MPRGTALLYLPWLLFACSDYGSGDKGGGSSGTGTGGSVRTVDDGVCGTAVPAPRRFPQMAYFFTEDPISTPTGDRQIQRGFVLYGGMDPSGHFSAATAMDDLWLYDLTSINRTDVCRWYRVTPAVSDPLFGGAMAYVEDREEFVILGGFEDVGDLQASSKARTLSLTNLAAGFTSTDVLGDLSYAISEMGSASCRGTKSIDCIDSETCALIDESVPFDPCNPPDAVDAWDAATCMHLDPADMYVTCATDVQCETGEEGVPLTVTAPGLALAGAAYDPVSEELTLHGGVTGCMGACGAWTSLFAADLEGDFQLLGANAEYGHVVDLSGAAPSATAFWTDFWDHAHPDWPSQASVGLHGLAAAAAGQEWELASRSWTHTGGSLTDVIAGGTTFQHLAPSTEEVTECTAWNDCGGCTEYGGTATVTGDEPCADENACAATPSDVVSTAAGGAYASISSSVSSVVHPALLPLPDRHVAVIGGRSSSTPGGSSLVELVDVATGSTAGSFDLTTDRWGAGAVYDPVGRRGYVFGGDASSQEVEELNFDTKADANGGTFGITDYHANLAFDGTTWTAGATWSQTYSCGDATCYADTLWVHVPENESSVVDNVDIEITYLDSAGTIRTVTPARSTTAVALSGTDVRQLTYHLPVVVADGETLTVELSYHPTVSVRTSLWNASEGGEYGLQQFSYGPTASPSVGYRMAAVPAWPGLGTTPTLAAQQTLTVEDYTFDLPTSLLVVAPGTPDTETPVGTAIYSGYEPFWPISHPVYLLEDVSRLESGGKPYAVAVDGGAATARVYVDDYLTASAAAEVEGYVLGTGSSVGTTLADDLDFLVDRLGTAPTTSQNIVFLRANQSAPSDVVGLHERGTLFTLEFDHDGVLNDPAQMASTTLHEFAHWYYGEHLLLRDEQTNWLTEAVPVLLELERYPSDNADALTTGQAELLASHTSGTSSAVAPEILADDRRRYTIGPYVLSQLYWLSLMDPTADFWGAFSSMVTSASYGETLIASDTSTALNPLASSSFYGEWVAPGMFGIPLLGITRLDYVGVDPGTAGWTGVPVYEYEVRQVQFAMKGWDVYTDVPYTIGCELDDHAGVKAFAECGSLEGGLTSPTTIYDMAGAVAVTGTLTGSAELGTTLAPTPVLMQLQKSANLFPGPTVGNDPTSSTQWLLACGPSDTSPSCLPSEDTDGDGAPLRGDCREAGSAAADVYPFQLAAGENPVDGTGIDYNCDGWSLN